MHDASLARAGIALELPRAEDIDRAEREITQGFTMPLASRDEGDTQPATPDLLSGGIDVSGTAPAEAAKTPTQTHPSRFGDEDDFSFGR
jgi:hypothetical protein